MKKSSSSTKRLIFSLAIIVIASGCTSFTSTSGQNIGVDAENIAASQNSDTTVDVEVTNATVLGVADPNHVISSFELGAAKPSASSVNATSGQEASDRRIGWIVRWNRTVNATVQLPVNTSKEPGVYKYSLVATNYGERATLERRINITN